MSCRAARGSNPMAMPDLPQLSRSLLAYTMWADTQFLDALAAIPAEHLTVATGTGFEELWPGMEFFLASLSEEQLTIDLSWISRGGNSYRRPLWQALVHMSHHSGYHRGQLTTMLRQLGHPAPSTDLIGWFANH